MTEDDESDTETFQMTLPEESVEWLREHFPDQMSKQERIRAVIAEVRYRRREGEWIGGDGADDRDDD